MDRRGFLKALGIGIGGIALDQAIPLGRVWSFPSKIIIDAPYALPAESVTTILLDQIAGIDFAWGDYEYLAKFDKLQRRGTLGRAVGFQYIDERIITEHTSKRSG